MNSLVKYLFIISFLFFACKKDDDSTLSSGNAPYVLEVPNGFPYPVIPSDNELTRERIELGRKLFYDPILSEDSSISCASCHLVNEAFTDGFSLSHGVHGRTTERNSPTLTNIGYHTDFFWDGGNFSLEVQIVGPIESVNEMNLPFPVLINRLKNHPEYPQLFKAAYNLNSPNVFGVTRAIAAFERTLISGNSNYDKYFYNNQNTLNAQEINGMNLFFSEDLKCAQCHGGFNFTNLNYENNGIYLNYIDSGRARITLNTDDAGKFKVPTLRNIEVTAPYMHDGSFNTLEEVIDHYSSGGKGHRNQSDLVSGFTISASEKQDLIAFLKTLTDHEFLNNIKFANPNE